MHWLPLVAMVIASALLFLRCPLPRLVAATMEPGNSIRIGSPVEHDSNGSRADFLLSANDKDGALHRTADKHNRKDSKKKQSQEKVAAGGGDSARTGDRAELRSHDLKSPALKAFKDRHILMNYKPKGGRFQENGGFEGTGTRDRKIRLKDRNTDRTRNRKILLKDQDKDGTQGKRTLIKDNDSDGTHGKRTLQQEGDNEGFDSKKTLLKDRDNDGNLGRRTEMKGQKKQQNSLLNQVLDFQPPVEGASGESGNRGSLEGFDLGLEEALLDEELLLLTSHPRVLFTTSPTPPKHPPLQLLLESGLMPGEEEDDEEEYEEQTSSDVNRTDGEFYRNLLLGLSASDVQLSARSSQHPSRAARQKRQVGLEGRERAACESVSTWVMNRKTAIDFKMRNVTVVEHFETKKGKFAQMFFETSCRRPKSRVPSGEHGVAGGDCLGVDKKHWASECRTKQGYVRAFTSDSNGRKFWNWIRIDSSCVCVLQSKNHRNNYQG